MKQRGGVRGKCVLEAVEGSRGLRTEFPFQIVDREIQGHSQLCSFLRLQITTLIHEFLNLTTNRIEPGKLFLKRRHTTSGLMR